MVEYRAPLRDMRFVWGELFSLGPLQQLPGYEEVTPDLVEAILQEAARFCEKELAPLNRSGEREGCRLENGVVRTPKGFREAYRAFVEGGWGALNCAPEYGGQGLPHTVHVLVEEMMCSSNLAFSLYPGLTHGAYVALERFGSRELQAIYLPKLASGAWSGTMCLTEPQAGTDLGLCRTRAVPQEDGRYRVTGTKIFISAGEHDLTENIIHLVLARTPGAPPGTQGISVFLVPKFLPTATEPVGARNSVLCGALEDKMGLHGAATCVLHFEDAQGFLVGEVNKGMRAMFSMMNKERLAVGIQGLGLAEIAYQGAARYARERLQGRSPAGAQHPHKPADPIIVHPDVRRMLLTMRAYIEASRALAVWVAMALDRASRHADPSQRQEASDLVALLTPVVKALFTDLGFEVTNLGLQVFGGHGYIRDYGMEQFVRDARVSQLYEGTNGIQGLDLVGRKLPAHTGRYLRRFFHPVFHFIETHRADDRLKEFIGPLEKAFVRLQRATGFIAEQGLRDPEEAAAAATDYLRLFGLVALAYLWARMAQVALEKQAEDEAGFYAAKLATARFFMVRLLPQSGSLLAAILAGKESVMALEESAF
ncbi:MAG: acyl-CoA dehydrogenase C-terminal domain-containing protein [Gammaproteobacteria bacterium]